MTLAAAGRIATYARVSSEDQAERGTIRTQQAELARWLERMPGLELAGEYVDDGVSGTIPLAERPGGGRLLRAAAAGQFEALLVYQVDRLGRDALDLLALRRRLEALAIVLYTVVEGEPNALGFDIQAVVGDYYRHELLRRTADGIDRAAREGRYVGGIVAFGYRVEGEKRSARLVIDERPLPTGPSPAEVVRRIYGRLALEGWGTRRIAAELNALNVPTHYARDGRGVRGQATQGLWRAGRIGNLVRNPTYKGELVFGKRTGKLDRERISAPVPALVSVELWQAAREQLARNRTCPKNTRRAYLLRGVIHCTSDGLTFTGSQGRPGQAYYRCDGKTIERGPLEGRCPSRLVRGEWLEALVWADVEAFLRDPGELLTELETTLELEQAEAIAEAEAITLGRALEELVSQRARALDAHVRGRMTAAELDATLERIDAERSQFAARLDALEPPGAPDATVHPDLLVELRARLDAGLTIEQRQEIVRLLVRVTVHTEVADSGEKRARLALRYRFPGGGTARTVRGSWPPPVAPGPGSGPAH